ncbi:MAG: hypothetical protein IPJ45_17490 [Ignavibacteria bacterium]|nr:hypothetical protein [Ignavibacteria bacterium]
MKTLAIIQKGTYTLTNGQIMGGWGGCLCGGRNDCLCKIIAINNYSHTDLTKFSSDLSLLNLTSYVVLGNKLKIQFEERLKLVSNNFTQKEEVNVGSDLCKELGYTSVTILPGNYTITDSNSITFNIIVDNKSNDIN